MTRTLYELMMDRARSAEVDVARLRSALRECADASEALLDGVPEIEDTMGWETESKRVRRVIEYSRSILEGTEP
jgi:hypothetical protein